MAGLGNPDMSPRLLARLSDETLGGRLALGEAAAFDELYRRYSHRLAAYGAHLLGDQTAGDDVAQATLLKAYTALRAGRVPDTVRPWLYRVAHNTAIDLFARRREYPVADVPEGQSPEGTQAGALVTALAGLPEIQRRVYVLREVHGLRVAETAAELGLKPPQVEQALFAARNRLAELLVFGGRLSCVSVRRLATGPLDWRERRALKTHLRSCPDCRSVVGARSGAFGFTPRVPLEWLRELIGLGGMPAVAKIGVAAVAAATMGSGAAAPAISTALHGGPVARPAAPVIKHSQLPRHVAQVPVEAQSTSGGDVSRSSQSVRAAQHRDNAPYAQHGDEGRSTSVQSGDGEPSRRSGRQRSSDGHATPAASPSDGSSGSTGGGDWLAANAGPVGLSASDGSTPDGSSGVGPWDSTSSSESSGSADGSGSADSFGSSGGSSGSWDSSTSTSGDNGSDGGSTSSGDASSGN